MNSIYFLITFVYIFIGVIFMVYWWNTVFAKDYEYVKLNSGNTDDGAAGIILICMMTLWPIILIYKIAKMLFKMI